MNKREKLSNILKILFISIILPIVLGYILNNIFINKYVSIPIHSVLESIGGFIALILAFIIFKLFNKKVLNHLHYTSIALIAMGIIDIFHALLTPGEMFVWLHSLAVFVGGLLFLTVFLKDIQVSNNIYFKLPIFIGLSSIFISILSILNPELIPQMLNEDKTFTDFSIAMNIIGGLGFIISGIYYTNRYIKYGYKEDILFVGHTFLFGIAGILFASSSLWDAQWWLWHILRLCAYLIALHYMYSIFNYQIAQKEKEERISNNILNSQSNFTVITDGRKLIKVNQTVLDFFGYKTLDEFKKEHDCICDFFIKEEGYLYQEKDDDENNWLDTVLENLNHNYQVKVLDTKNNIHIFQINTTGQKLENLYVVTLTDITLIEQLYNDNMHQEKILLEQSKMAAMGEMLGNIAHQWRQPLNTISVTASGMFLKYEHNLLTSEDMKKFSQTIVQSTKFLSDTINTFRNFFKEDKLSKDISIHEEILQAKNITHAVLKNKFIELRDNINYESTINIDMAPGELTQVIINIINNSKDILFEKEIKKPWIQLDLVKESNNFIISIEDNGGGIPENILPRIFEPYFTTKHQSQGTGLGLHMSYRIITESMKGSLWAQNTNNGVKLLIKLPLQN